MDPKAPAHHHAPLGIAPETFLIRSLYGEGEAPMAVYVNSMVILGEEPIVVDTGTLGNRDHWLDDVFDPTTGVLWAADAFATAVPSAVDDVADLDPDLWAESFSLLNRVVSPWHELVDPALFGAVVDRTAALAPTVIASGHSPVISGPHVAEALRMIRQVAGAPAAPLPRQADLDAIAAAATGAAA